MFKVNDNNTRMTSFDSFSPKTTPMHLHYVMLYVTCVVKIISSFKDTLKAFNDFKNKSKSV